MCNGSSDVSFIFLVLFFNLFFVRVWGWVEEEKGKGEGEEEGEGGRDT